MTNGNKNVVYIPVPQNEGGREGEEEEEEEGKYMYGDFDWSCGENENVADLYTRGARVV